MDGIIDGNKNDQGTFIDNLLSLQKSKPHGFSDSIIKGLLDISIAYLGYHSH